MSFDARTIKNLREQLSKAGSPWSSWALFFLAAYELGGLHGIEVEFSVEKRHYRGKIGQLELVFKDGSFAFHFLRLFQQTEKGWKTHTPFTHRIPLDEYRLGFDGEKLIGMSKMPNEVFVIHLDGEEVDPAFIDV